MSEGALPEICLNLTLSWHPVLSPWSSLERHLHLMSVFPARDLPRMSLSRVDCTKQGGETNTTILERHSCSIWYFSSFQDLFERSHRWVVECALRAWLLEKLELPKTPYLKIKVLYLLVRLENISILNRCGLDGWPTYSWSLSILRFYAGVLASLFKVWYFNNQLWKPIWIN